MTTDKLSTKKLFASLDNAASELIQMISSLSEAAINTVPFKDSWTAAQLVTHVTKSNTSIAQALNMEAETAERDPGERVQELKEMFLDFTIKFQAAEFILPAPGAYEKETVIAKLKRSFEQLKEMASNINLSGMISHPAFGDITKFELLYFVLYHTQRHIHQLKNIFEIVKNK